MTSILYKGKRFNIIRTETIALPQFATEIATEFEGVSFNFIFNGIKTEGFGVVPRFSDNVLNYALTGFNNSLGSYFDVPIGDKDGKALHLSVTVHGVHGEGDIDQIARLVTISFFVEV